MGIGVVSASARSLILPLTRAFDIQGGFATFRVALGAPSLWSPEEQADFAQSLADLAQRGDLRAVILCGDGLFSEPDAPGQPAFRVVVDAIAECAVPVVAAITGEATGAGLELALACAARVATPSSQFHLTSVQRGRLPTHGAIERLPRLIGMRRAAAMIALSERMDALEALRCGLVAALANEDDLFATACGVAGGLKSAPPFAVVDPEEAAAELHGLRNILRRNGPEQGARLATLKALETAARLPVRRAMVETARQAEALARSDQSQALGYAHEGAGLLGRWRTSEARQRLALRLRWPLLREAIHLLDEGASPGQIDRRMIAFGFPEGPFAEADRRGLNHVFTIGLDGEPPEPWLSYSPTLDLMIDAGRLGGDKPGWYLPGDTSLGVPAFDREVGDLILGSATSQRLSRHPIDDETVTDRLLLAAINGAAEALQQEPDLNPAIVDAAWTSLLGFPAWKGGPLRLANEMGLARVVEHLARLAGRRNTAGAPCEILRRRAERGESLA
jgi:enoyl-CoA hydratase/carnithine racemase